MAGHKLSVLLLQLIVPLLSGLSSFCADDKEDSVILTFSMIISMSVYNLYVCLLTVHLTFCLNEGVL